MYAHPQWKEKKKKSIWNVVEKRSFGLIRLFCCFGGGEGGRGRSLEEGGDDASTKLTPSKRPFLSTNVR